MYLIRQLSFPSLSALFLCRVGKEAFRSFVGLSLRLDVETQLFIASMVPYAENHSAWAGGSMGSLWQDVRYGMRVLRKSPRFTAIGVLTLALGIGANTAVFSVVNGVLLRSLPFPQSDRLFSVYWKTSTSEQRVTYLNFLDWQRDNRTFQSLAAYREDDFNFTGLEEPERLHGKMISAGFFELLGIPPVLGRTFLSAEDVLGARPVVLLSAGFWKRRFGADLNILGRSLALNGKDYTVVGVIPGSFRLGSPAEVFVPLGQWEEKAFRDRKLSMNTQAVGRLKPDATPAQASADMDAVGRQLAAAYPDADAGTSITLIPLKKDIVGSLGTELLLLLGAVGSVLLIACANVGNLLLARVAKREREMAVRVALGASPFRIVRQLLIESVLLGLAGGALGLLLAAAGTRAALAALPAALPQIQSIQMDLRVFGFTLAVSVLVGIVFGLVPALKIAHPNLQETLKGGGRGDSGRRPGAQSVFVVAEIAVALILLAGAGLMIRSLAQLAEVDPGFDPHNVLVFRLALSPETASQAAKIRLRYNELLESLKALPGVQLSAALMGSVPMTDFSEIPYWKDGEAKPASQNEMQFALYYFVSADYFRVLHIPLVRGRYLTPQDTETTPLVVVIDQEMAGQLFRTQDPIGKRFNIDFIGPAQIVGVAGHVKQSGLDSDSRASVRQEFYLPFRQVPDQYLPLECTEANVLVRTAGSPLALAGAIRHTVQSLDSRQIMYGERTMEEIMGASLAQRRFGMILLGAFAGLALLLSGIGIYGVLSYVVAERTHEIGIRMALGAGAPEILRLVLGRGGRMVLAGTLLGLAGAASLTRLISGMLYGVSATDPLTFGGVALLLAAVALLACYIPARRATRVEPTVALRYE
jgi:predicted permease